MTSLLLKPFKVIWLILRFLRECILNILLLIVIAAMIGLFSLSSKLGDSKPILDNSPYFLNVNLSGDLVDDIQTTTQFYGVDIELPLSTKSSSYSVIHLMTQIDQARQDKNVLGLVLSLDKFESASLTSLALIGKYLDAFKKSGKPVYAIGASYNRIQYYLASFADTISLRPQGSVNFYGFNSSNLFYKDLIDKLDVNMHVFRVGTYKSAVEPFLRNDMSDEARASTLRWLTGLWENVVDDVAKNRGLTRQEIAPDSAVMLAKLQASSGNLTHYAKAAKLVDSITTEQDFWTMLETKFGVNADNKRIKSIADYSVIPEQKSSNLPQIAVLFLNGEIVNESEMKNNYIAAESIVKSIRKLQKNPNVKAVVLRINTPGGSVTGSESIRNALQALHSEGKKIIVSMGDVTASGGYWIATESDAIIASRNTLTGSIGVFGIVPTFEKSLAKIGVTADGVSTSPLAANSMLQNLTPQFASLFQMSIDNTYQHFLDIVAKARKSTPEVIDQVAQGRVWIASDALANKLVDKIGDLDDAIATAAELAGIADYKINWVTSQESFLHTLLSKFSSNAINQIFAYLPASLQTIKHRVTQPQALFRHLDDPQNQYLYCLSCPQID